MKSDFADRIREFIKGNICDFEENLELNDEVNIFEAGFVDSLFSLQLISFIEGQFGIQVKDEDLDQKTLFMRAFRIEYGYCLLYHQQLKLSNKMEVAFMIECSTKYVSWWDVPMENRGHCISGG